MLKPIVLILLCWIVVTGTLKRGFVDVPPPSVAAEPSALRRCHKHRRPAWPVRHYCTMVLQVFAQH